MSHIESFSVGDSTYNVVRASALQQDEVLSLVSDALIQRIAASIHAKQESESAIFAMLLGVSFPLKKKLDELLLGKVVKSGESHNITVRDFDGQVMEWNRLRTKVLLWNLEGFFTYWANEVNDAIGKMQSQPSQETA